MKSLKLGMCIGDELPCQSAEINGSILFNMIERDAFMKHCILYKKNP